MPYLTPVDCLVTEVDTVLWEWTGARVALVGGLVAEQWRNPALPDAPLWLVNESDSWRLARDAEELACCAALNCTPPAWVWCELEVHREL